MLTLGPVYTRLLTLDLACSGRLDVEQLITHLLEEGTLRTLRQERRRKLRIRLDDAASLPARNNAGSTEWKPGPVPNAGTHVRMYARGR